MPKPLVIALALAGSFAVAHAADDLPKRDAGLWEMSTSLAEMGGLGMNMQMCVDDTIEDLMMQDDENSDCAEQSYRQDGNRVVFDATCTVDGSTARIDGVFTGDFAKHYQGEIKTTYTPPLEGMAATTMNIEARWIGPCKPGQQPGDAVMTGMTGMGEMNFGDLMQQMEKMKQR